LALSGGERPSAVVTAFFVSDYFRQGALANGADISRTQK
jgi:hypothetical protein